MPDNELIHAWLEKARRDLETARIIFSELPEYDDIIAFHCQQSIEKALKAFLIYMDIDFKPVHDLGYLMNLIATKERLLEPYYEQVDQASRFAVQIRYPDTIINLSRTQVMEVLDLAVRLLKLVNEWIQIK
jgi:HEPN domain-containing protein